MELMQETFGQTDVQIAPDCPVAQISTHLIFMAFIQGVCTDTPRVMRLLHEVRGTATPSWLWNLTGAKLTLWTVPRQPCLYFVVP